MKSVADYHWPMQNKNHRPFQHQKDTTEFLLRNLRAYVLSDIGTGKSLCPLWAFDILLCFGKVRKMLIVTPLSTMRVVWAKEIFTNLPHRRYAVAHGNKASRIAAIKSNSDFVIINHDGIKTVEREILDERFDVIVIDELTAFKNATSDRSKCMQRIAQRSKAIWGMTGNPTPNCPSESFGQAKVVNPSNPFLPRYYTKFLPMVVTEVAPYVYVPKPEAKNIVHKILQPSIRFERDQCLDLPPAFVTDIDIDMSAEQARAYKAMADELMFEYGSGEISAVNAAVKWSKLLQISAGSVKDDLGNVLHLNIDPKIEDLLQTFEELGRTKFIVVSAFRASVERLTSVFKGEKIRCEFIHGDVGMNERTRIINAFQDGDLQIMCLQPQAVAHGITLTAGNTIVWQSYVASGETYNQMNGRITRAGQTRKQYVRRQICSKAEKRMTNVILDGKMDLSQAVLKMFVDGDL